MSGISFSCALGCSNCNKARPSVWSKMSPLPRPSQIIPSVFQGVGAALRVDIARAIRKVVVRNRDDLANYLTHPVMTNRRLSAPRRREFPCPCSALLRGCDFAAAVDNPKLIIKEPNHGLEITCQSDPIGTLLRQSGRPSHHHVRIRSARRRHSRDCLGRERHPRLKY